MTQSVGALSTREQQLAACEKAMRAVARVGRHTFHAGAFEVFLAPPGASRFLSLAVPAGTPRARDVRAVERLFDAAGTPLRIEFLAERHPTLASLLVEEGLTRGRKDPVMVLERGALVRVEQPASGSYEEPSADSAAIEELLEAQARAFQMDGGAEGWAAILRDGIRSGLFRAGLVRDERGRAASGALLLGDGRVAELAGVGTLPGQRGRGFATFVSGRLVGAGFDSGLELVWLSADEAAAGVYRRLGFRSIGTQLNFESAADY